MTYDLPMAPVLVVEDHPDLRDMLAAMLQAEGYTVHTAANGAEALKSLDDEQPSVILLDLMMPVMTGGEFRIHQLADPRHCDVPVICMTAVHDARAWAQRLGAVEYFQKPVDFEGLLAAVRRHAARNGPLS